MKRIWDQVAPPAMFTATGNLTLANSENFLNALDMLNWNVTTQEGILGNDISVSDSATAGAVVGGLIGSTTGTIVGAATAAAAAAVNNAVNGTHDGNFGFSGTSEIRANTLPGSNNKPIFGKDDFNKYNVVGWEDSESEIRVPAGFSPIRGGNVCYADTLPPFDITLTFNSCSEYCYEVA